MDTYWWSIRRHRTRSPAGGADLPGRPRRRTGGGGSPVCSPRSCVQNRAVDLVISLDGATEKTVLVYRALREAIVDGRLPVGHRLPPPGVPAAGLGGARGSVATAYERLAAEGYLPSRVGSGTFVAGVPAPLRPRRAAADPLRPRAGWTFGPAPTSGQGPAPRYD